MPRRKKPRPLPARSTGNDSTVPRANEKKCRTPSVPKCRRLSNPSRVLRLVGILISYSDLYFFKTIESDKILLQKFLIIILLKKGFHRLCL
mmetsp:Transcript_359/g.667  ORF Transcript_359/g.667 Transcript_359/m.667 type:complete len:91 (+) Transcript_359:1370-1642(+)